MVAAFLKAWFRSVIGATQSLNGVEIYGRMAMSGCVNPHYFAFTTLNHATCVCTLSPASTHKLQCAWTTNASFTMMSQTLQTYQYLYGFYLCDDRLSNNEGKFNSNSKHTWLFLYLVIHSVIEAFPLLRFQQYWCNGDTAKRSVTSKYSQKVWKCLCKFRPVSHRGEICQLNSKYYLRSQHFFEVIMFFDV